jgi:hypothetical protein
MAAYGEYIEGYCDMQMAPPYSFQGVDIWSFPLLADLGTVQALVDKYLGPFQGQGQTFALIPGATPSQRQRTLVYMMVLDYARMRCMDGTLSGYLSQKEFLFGIVVRRTRSDAGPGGGPLADLAFFSPTIFVDNPSSSICGNTVLGYPKQLAWFQLPERNPYPIQIETQVFVDDDPDTGQSLQLIANIKDAMSLIPGAKALKSLFPFGDIERLFGPKGVFPLESAFFELFQRHNQQMSYDVIQLKQFRNAEDSRQASYKALVTGTVEIKTVRGAGLLPPAIVDLKSYASLSIPAELGLQSSGGLYLPLSPYWINCEFEMGQMTELPLLGAGGGTVPGPRVKARARRSPRKKA